MQNKSSYHLFAVLLSLLGAVALLLLIVSGMRQPLEQPEADAAVAAVRQRDATPTAGQPEATPEAAEQPIASATAVPATATPWVEPTPTPRAPGTPPRVGLQIGHLRSHELPDELERLRNNSGAFAAGYQEAEVNQDIALRVAALLEAQGVVVDLLPATVPPSYDADAFISIHADGNLSTNARGFKLATPWRTSPASRHLLEAITAEYGAATGLPWDNNITVNMRGYYAFNNRRYDHAIARTTPAVIVEMGFLTSPVDRALMIGQPDLVAQGIASGILRYLNERDPLNGAALLPVEYGIHQAASSDGVLVRAAPSDHAEVLLHAAADVRLVPFQENNGWYEVFVRGERRVIGWVRASDVKAAEDGS